MKRLIGIGVRRRPPTVGAGVNDRPGLVRIVCAFDEETFEQVRSRAVKDQTSFAEQVRQLVEWGLEADQIARDA